MQPLSQVLLSIPKALNDELITDSGLKFYLDPTYKKEWNAAVTATVEELPVKYNEKEQKILCNISKGDEVAISYQVVADLEFKGDGDRFQRVTEENPYVQEFANGKGEWIRCYALPTRKGIKKATWVGAYTDKYGKFIDGCQGDQSDLERWMSQFPFGKTDIYNHCNLFSFRKQSYWKADPGQIFAKKVNGRVVAIGNRIICKPIDEELPYEMKGKIIETRDIKLRYQDRARVISSTRKDIKKDYIVSFQPNHVEKYTLWGVEYYLINERFVNGLWKN